MSDTLVKDAKTIEVMDIKDVWQNYSLAMALMKALPAGSTNFDRYLLLEVARKSLETFFQRVEAELW